MRGLFGGELVMPGRLLTDGPVSVRRGGTRDIQVSVVNAGHESAIEMSEHNAWRLFGSLALMLGIPLGRRVGQLIKL
jgi:hypothetical protein